MDTITIYEGPHTLGEVYRLYGIHTRDLDVDIAALSDGGVITRRVNDISQVVITKDVARFVRDV